MQRRTFLKAALSTIILPISIVRVHAAIDDLAARIAAAKVSADRRLYLPAGDYILPAGIMLDVS